jgi:GNAT superfamily N-acetyltransferase
MRYSTRLSESPEKHFAEFLHGRIKDFNDRHSAQHREARAEGTVGYLHLILEDETGAPIGGLSASLYWDWLEIVDFFVPEALRGRGIGTELLRSAEAEAARRGARHCFLSTFEFQARAFYERHGYAVAGMLEGYPPGSCFYWMRKELAGEGS